MKGISYFFKKSFKIIYIDHVPGNQIPIPSVYNMPLLLFYLFNYVFFVKNMCHQFVFQEHALYKLIAV